MIRGTVPTQQAGRCAAAVMLVAIAMCASPVGAQAQSLSLHLESREAYAGLPFVLSLQAKDFEENPAPVEPTIEIPGCRVTYLGMNPSVSSMVQIINGQRTESRDVTFVYRYRIEAPKAGTFTVPAVTLTQGNRSASSPGGQFTVTEVATTKDMRIELVLPERAVYVGETIEVMIDWYLAKDVRDQSFVVPLFDEDKVDVEPASIPGAAVLAFTAGARDVQLPYEREQITSGARTFTRFRFHALVTPNRAGAIELEPTRVVAKLESGWGRDSFGFRVRRHELFKAEDTARQLSVRPLPQAGRPESFAGAIGTSFSIAVQASRTVVQAGDPIELTVQLRGNGRLEGMVLPPLDAAGGLAPELFSVPDEIASGVIDEGGTVKTFNVTVRLKSVEASEIPALAFSYFDPGAAAYRTVHSEPIALSVKGSRVVDASDVVGRSDHPVTGAGSGGDPAGTGEDGQSTPTVPGSGSLVGADLSLSTASVTLHRAMTVRDTRPWLLALYVLPLVTAAWCVWRARTRGRRTRVGEIRERAGEVKSVLDEAHRLPAREVAPRLLTTLRAAARLRGDLSPADQALFERIETEGYNPVAADQPLAAALLAEASEAVERWQRDALDDAMATRSGGGPASGLAVIAVLLLGGVSAAQAQTVVDVDQQLAAARELYQQALVEQDPVRRTRIFAESERALRPVAEQESDRPELLVDWGNAALGAHDLGRAALAYRRALRLDPGHERARSNLAWVRNRLPAWMPRPAQKRALDTLMFWRESLSTARLYVYGALAFAIGVLLLAPWPGARRPARRRIAVVPILAWLALTGSALADRGDDSAAVVLIDGMELRSADSDGAPAAFSSPLPAGAEIAVLEVRDAWSRVTLADGTRGWIRSHAIERVVP